MCFFPRYSDHKWLELWGKKQDISIEAGRYVQTSGHALAQLFLIMTLMKDDPLPWRWSCRDGLMNYEFGSCLVNTLHFSISDRTVTKPTLWFL